MHRSVLTQSLSECKALQAKNAGDGKMRRDLSDRACITFAMTTRRFPCLGAFFFLLACPLFSTPGNVLLILSDDHRYDFMSFMEEAPEFLETPNLDRLAGEGVLFTSFHVSPSCAPSRAMLQSLDGTCSGCGGGMPVRQQQRRWTRSGTGTSGRPASSTGSQNIL